MEKTKDISETNPYPKTDYNPYIHPEYNYNRNINLNEAEKNALQQIENSKKINDLRKSKNKEFKKKYNEKILSYQDEQKKKNAEEEITKKSEYLLRMQKLQNFNKTLQEKNMKKKLINNNRHLIWTKPDLMQNKTKTKSKSNNKIINEKKCKEILVINHNDTNNDVINLKNSDSNFIKKKTILIKSVKNEDNIINDLNTSDKINIEESKNIDNENIIDLRNNIQLLIDTKYNKKEKSLNEDIKDKINERINDLKRFRYDGTFPEKIAYTPTHQKKNIFKNKKFLSEFEKKRYIKALKHIFTERLGEHNIYIQNICSCGNLQKQLTALVEKGNLTVYGLTDVECANNCAFYKNKKEYMKNINDILRSIKNIKYENFHNKYK